jgi:NTP pyrophosphatase (non-canonical NTP hydrolase)
MEEIKVKWNENRLADKPNDGLDALIFQIENWGKDRKITINGNPITQAIKTLEETHELLEAVNRKDQHEIRDAIGDIIVTLIMQCKLQGMTIEDCLFFSFQEIKDRKGELNEVGDFIKK